MKYKNDTHNFLAENPTTILTTRQRRQSVHPKEKKNAIYDEDSIYKHELNACGIGFIRKHDWINQKRYPPNKPSRLWVYIPVKTKKDKK